MLTVSACEWNAQFNVECYVSGWLYCALRACGCVLFKVIVLTYAQS